MHEQGGHPALVLVLAPLNEPQREMGVQHEMVITRGGPHTPHRVNTMTKLFH